MESETTRVHLRTPPATITTASGVRVHGIQTGVLALKTAHRAFRGPSPLRLPTILLDRRWTAPLPMLVWVIEHPEGLILIDTGEVATATHPEAYLAGQQDLAWFVGRNFRIAIGRDEEITTQLRTLGLDPEDVRWVIQTHLHFDHTGGLPFFPRARVLVGKREHDQPPRGAALSLWPSWYRPELVEYRHRQPGPFPNRYVATRAGDVQIIPTPGHTRGHQSIMLDDGVHRYLFAGDAAFSEGALWRSEVAGIVADVGLTRRTTMQLQALLREGRTVFLPTHDPDALARLARQQPATAP